VSFSTVMVKAMGGYVLARPTAAVSRLVYSSTNQSLGGRTVQTAGYCREKAPDGWTNSFNSICGLGTGVAVGGTGLAVGDAVTVGDGVSVGVTVGGIGVNVGVSVGVGVLVGV